MAFLAIMAGCLYALGMEATTEHIARVTHADPDHMGIVIASCILWPVYWTIVALSVPMTKLLPPPGDHL